MKRIIVLLLILFLCSCEKPFSYEDLGYTNKEARIIETLNDEMKEELLTYNPVFCEIVNNENFIKANLKDYLKFYGRYDTNTLIILVNNGLTIHFDKIDELMTDPYFVFDNLKTYLSYYSKYESIRELVEAVNTKSCFEQYTNMTKTDTSKGYLMLVNKFYYLEEDYVPDLVVVDSKYDKWPIELERNCYEAYKLMAEDAAKLGLNLLINSGYRSYSLQQNSYNNFLTIDPQEVVDTYSARPGHSEHQTGLAIDIVPEGYNFGNVGLSPEAKWMAENCDKYGFIMRYIEGKENVTLYEAEPWQVRYVGDIASDIKNSGLTFDEYYEVYIK